MSEWIQEIEKRKNEIKCFKCGEPNKRICNCAKIEWEKTMAKPGVCKICTKIH
jgi:hypothetical protein